MVKTLFGVLFENENDRIGTTLITNILYVYMLRAMSKF